MCLLINVENRYCKYNIINFSTYFLINFNNIDDLYFQIALLIFEYISSKFFKKIS